jgi:hypothetical protein
MHTNSNRTASDYFDFELEIGMGSGPEYPVSVLRSPAGEARETRVFPYDTPALESCLKDLQIALLRPVTTRRRALSSEEQAVEDFGRTLFGFLFGGEVRSRYDVSLREAAQQGKGLRLKLHIQPPELAVLPWEYLYDPRQAEYVCLSRNTPIVRYIDLPQSIRPMSVTPPLRILGMVASPQGQSPLSIAHEKQRVESAIQSLQTPGLIELEWMQGQTWRDLQRAMWGGPWHIFHFVGHGGFDRYADEGYILLADEQGAEERLSATQLGRLLADHRSLRLVLLNACEGARGSERDIFSSTAAILVRRGVLAVVAMQYGIIDQAAVTFARTFYEALVYGKPVDEAVVAARKAISLASPNTVEWGTPVLYMRSPDGVLFDVAQDLPRAQRHPSESQVLETSPMPAHPPAGDAKSARAAANGTTSRGERTHDQSSVPAQERGRTSDRQVVEAEGIIRLRRITQREGGGGRYGVFVDGAKVGTLKAGHTISVKAKAGTHQVQVNWFALRSEAFSLQLEAGETAHLVCGQRPIKVLGLETNVSKFFVEFDE